MLMQLDELYVLGFLSLSVYTSCDNIQLAIQYIHPEDANIVDITRFDASCCLQNYVRKRSSGFLFPHPTKNGQNISV
jgi:hypothetical protein